jgi:formate hydrogenlyase subunit 3/multisubunit Na+/H+ antiporter MnhD subunit
MTDPGALLALGVLGPMAFGALSLLAPGAGRRLTLPAWLLVTALVALPAALYRTPIGYPLGAWSAPLGIPLVADGIALLMLLLTAAVFGAVFLYAHAWFTPQSREDRLFRPLAWLLWSALNATFLSGDLFNQFVTLELLSLCAVGLAALGGTRGALGPALRYLLAVLAGSNLFLLGVGLLYATTGVLALDEIAARLAPGPPTTMAIALLNTALVLKTALLPLHFWLPPAHAGAPAPVSALLSALVIKASFLVLLRIGLALEPAVDADMVRTLLAGAGAGAVLWGSAAALVQERVKMVVAYSTVAQVGYLFIALRWLSADTPVATLALEAIVFQVLAHALAKAALFLGAGALLKASGGDRIDTLRGMATREPLLVFSVALAGASLVGLPPSLGFAAKWQLLQAALQAGDRVLALVILAGSLMAAGYVYRLLRPTLADSVPSLSGGTLGAGMRLAPFILALLAVGGGLAAALLAAHFDPGSALR